MTSPAAAGICASDVASRDPVHDEAVGTIERGNLQDGREWTGRRSVLAEEDVGTADVRPGGTIQVPGRDQEIVDAVAIDVASSSYRLCPEPVVHSLAVDGEAVAAVERGEVEGGGEVRLTEDHLHLASLSAAGRGRLGFRDDDVADSIVVDVACAAAASAPTIHAGVTRGMTNPSEPSPPLAGSRLLNSKTAGKKLPWVESRP